MKNFVDKWEEANKVNTEDLPYIDDGKRKLFYRFTPSKTNPVDAPLFVILHGHGTRKATRFQREGWNVLSPIDHFGYEGKGAWWLGENGDFFVRDLLQKLIRQIAQKYNSENNIYIYGSSMGGYGAILHGILCSARAVYANVPQIKLLDTIYSERMMKRYFSTIFSNNIPIENDLKNFLASYEDVSKFPIFYLCENVVSGKNAYENYLLEHTDSFVDKCKKYNIKFYLELLPKSGHDKNYGLGEVLDKFKHFTPLIVNQKDENKLKNVDQLVEGEEQKMSERNEKKPNIEDLLRFEKDLWLFKDTENLENIEKELINMISDNPSDSLKYKKSFFVPSKDIDLELAIKYGEEVLKEEQDPKFMKVLAVRYKRIGNDLKYNNLMSRKIPMEILKNKLDEISNEKVSFEAIENYIKLFIDRFQELELDTYKVAFSKLKDIYVNEAVRFGEEVIKKEQDPKFIKVLATRYKKIGNLERYETLNDMIF